jgi:type VI protein secretion system component VasK
MAASARSGSGTSSFIVAILALLVCELFVFKSSEERWLVGIVVFGFGWLIAYIIFWTPGLVAAKMRESKTKAALAKAAQRQGG